MRDARVRAGFESGVRFARAVGLTQSTLSRIESGKRPVTVPELAMIASVVGVPPESFLETQASGGAFFRLADNTPLAGEIDRAVRWLEKFAYRIQALREFTPDAEIPRPDALAHQAPKDFAEAALIAQQVRRSVGLSEGPVPDLIELLERVGCLVVVRPLGAAGPDAVYVPRPLGIVLLNGSRPRVRQRFTLAHELAHHVFHGTLVTVDVDIWASRTRAEQFCNTFAAHFLMPRHGIESELQQRFGLRRPQRPVHAFWLANHFGVSLEAMCYQLANLQLIPHSTAKTWRDEDRRALGYGLGVTDYRQRPPVEKRWPPELLERLRFALQRGVLDRAQVKRHLDGDAQAVSAVMTPA
ncbi:MAG: XRE family transcriptional regulator [Chloroflexota bacterium]|nr:XRE family transcriptional regulator [Chloroflexota bacterium]